ncbi:uncharacterized protein [Anabrus simplex]|uniref:uncharacterized protein n=1 Tax=Anabrus simplex TaxID=316456 RepID=UPI0035A36073
MRDDQKFNIQFVSIVERYPVIYDYTKTGYSKKNVIDKIWAEIAAAVKDQLKENCSENDCKRRWRVLRSSYVRSKNKKMKSSEGFMDHKEYYLSECMKFLHPFTKSRPQNGSIPSSSDREHPGDNEIFQDEDEEDDPESTSDAARAETREEAVNTYPGRQVPVIRNIKQNEEIDRKAVLSCEAESSKSTDSPDLHFFKGLLPHVEGFSLQEKLTFQKGVLEVISNIYDQRSSRTVDQ